MIPESRFHHGSDRAPPPFLLRWGTIWWIKDTKIDTIVCHSIQPAPKTPLDSEAGAISTIMFCSWNWSVAEVNHTFFYPHTLTGLFKMRRMYGQGHSLTWTLTSWLSNAWPIQKCVQKLKQFYFYTFSSEKHYWWLSLQSFLRQRARGSLTGFQR